MVFWQIWALLKVGFVNTSSMLPTLEEDLTASFRHYDRDGSRSVEKYRRGRILYLSRLLPKIKGIWAIIVGTLEFRYLDPKSM